MNNLSFDVGSSRIAYEELPNAKSGYSNGGCVFVGIPTIVRQRLHVHISILSSRSYGISNFIYRYGVDFTNMLLKYLE